MASSPSKPQQPRQSPQRLVEIFVPQCGGSYGQCSRSAANFRADGRAADTSAEFIHQVRQVPPVEDVMRWKEFRRRQKMETHDNLRQQEQDQPLQVHRKIGENNRRCLGDKLLSTAADCDRGGAKALAASTAGSLEGAALFSCGDSNSLSFSESTAFGNPDTKHHSLKASVTSDTISQTMPSSVETQSNSRGNEYPEKDTALSSMDMGGAVIEIIDTEGFPVFSPTSTASGISIDDNEKMDENHMNNKIAQSAFSISQSCKGSSAVLTNTENYSDLVKEVDDFFSTLDCTLDAIAKRNNITITASLSDEPVSEVATEIVSNTARYVTDQSNKMARRMMLLMNEDTTTATDTKTPLGGIINKNIGTNDGSKACGITTPSSTFEGYSSVAKDAVNTLPFNAATPGNVATKGMPRLLTPPTTSTESANHQIQLAATPSFTPSSSTLKSTPNTTVAEPSPGWDCTKTTVSSDLLESVLATPKEKDTMDELSTEIESKSEVEEGHCKENDAEDCNDNVNTNDLSIVSSNWDPLQMSMNQEVDMVDAVLEKANVDGIDGEEGRHTKFALDDAGESAAIGQHVCEKSKSTPSEKSDSSHQSFTSTSSTFGEAPTFAEVTNFMSQLKQLREENSSLAMTNTTNGVADSTMQLLVESKTIDEHHASDAECTMPLLEYKEWLRQHKLDTNRKNSVIYEQLKAIRCNVYGDSGDDGSVAEVKTEQKCDQDEFGTSPGKSNILLVGSVASLSPTNSFAKERNSESTLSNVIDRTPVKISAQESECFPTDEKRTPISSESITSTAVQKQHLQMCSGRSLPLSPLAPAAHCSGGLARWSPSNDANTLPSPPQHRGKPEKKLKIAINEDDFSFKPPSLASAAGNNIVISPIVVGTVAAAFGKSASTRFNFASSPDGNSSKPQEASSSPVGSLSSKSPNTELGQNASTTSKPLFSPSSKISLSPVTSKHRSNKPARANGLSVIVPTVEANADAVVSGLDGSLFRPEEGASHHDKLSPPEQLQIIASTDPESPKRSDSVQRRENESSEVSSGPNAPSSTSPDMSEGDKGGGFAYSYPFLRSDVTTTSSKFVELGQEKASQTLLGGIGEVAEESNVVPTSPSLLGVTVVGSKLKKKKSKQKKESSSPVVQSVEEQDSLCSTHESENPASNCEDSGEANCDSSVRKPLDPDGYDWKEIDAQQKAAQASTAAIGQLDVIPENEDVLEGREKKCPTPSESNPFQHKHKPEQCGRMNGPAPSKAVDGECIASISKVNTPSETDNLNRLQTKSDLDVTSETIYLTPQSVLSKDGWPGKRKPGSSSVREMQTVFMASQNAPTSSREEHLKRLAPSLQFNNASRESKNIVGPDLKGFSFGTASLAAPENQAHSPPPDSTSIVEILNVKSEDDMNSSKASETMSIKELRSIFEPLQRESLNIRDRFRNHIKGSTVIGRGFYLKNRDIQAMSSLGSETYDTLESSMGKTTAYESTIGEGSLGDGTLDTKKILRYAKRLEQKGHVESEECDSFKSFGSAIEKKDTSNSLKENQTGKGDLNPINSGNIVHGDFNVRNTSSLEMLKNVFDSKRNVRSVTNTVVQEQPITTKPSDLNKTMPERKKSTNDTWLLRKRDTKLSANNVAHSSDGDVTSAKPMQTESSATSVKERIAVFSGKKDARVGVYSQSPIKVPRQNASPNKVVVPLQQQLPVGINRGPNQGPSFNRQLQTSQSPIRGNLPLQHQTPPRHIINTSHATATPSPMQVANQSNWPNNPVHGIHPSPYHTSNNGGRLSYNVPTPPVRFPTPNRPAPVLTRNESRNASNYDNDDDDGITLSPTFSEVSGLTLPTCLGTLNCESSTQSTLFDNLSRNGTLFHETMSPIARHRKQQERSDISHGGAKLSTHPYMQRLKVPVVHSTVEKSINNTIDGADRLHEIKTPRARGSPNISKEHTAVSRREQIVSRVRASPRYKRSPRDSAAGFHSNPSNSNSQGWQQERSNTHGQWQERNVIAENSNSLSSSGDNSAIFHFDGRGKDPEKPRGRVSETVERVNRKHVKDMRHGNQHQEQQRGRLRQAGGDRRGKKGGNSLNEEQGNSLATTECIRIA